LTGHNGLIYTLDIGNIELPNADSPKLFAFTGSLDETIKVWDLEAAKCLTTWKPLRPYEGMQIDRIQGLTKAQRGTLQALGAINSPKDAREAPRFIQEQCLGWDSRLSS
jgi:WD40 repeat protein